MDRAAPPRLDQRRGVSAREDRRALELDARGELTQPPHARLDPRTAHRGRAPPHRRALLARPSVPLGEGPAPAFHRRDTEIDELDRLAAALVTVARPMGRDERHAQGRGVVGAPPPRRAPPPPPAPPAGGAGGAPPPGAPGGAPAPAAGGGRGRTSSASGLPAPSQPSTRRAPVTGGRPPPRP